MSSEAAFEVAPMVGNACVGQRGSGHSAVPEAQHASRLRAGSHAGLRAGRGSRQTTRIRGVRAPALELQPAWEGPDSEEWHAEPRSEPDSGNPTVRDRRGALGDVTHGEPRNPTRNRKSGLGHSSSTGARAQDLSRQPHVRFDERDVETEQGGASEAPATERVGKQMGFFYITAPHSDSTPWAPQRPSATCAAQLSAMFR